MCRLSIDIGIEAQELTNCLPNNEGTSIYCMMINMKAILRRIILTTGCIANSLTMVAHEKAPLGQSEWITGSTYSAIPRSAMTNGIAMPMFRKVIVCDKPIEKATLTATALGVYDIIVNGQHVDGHELKPGWTDYRKEVTCQTMDITSLLHKGENEICAQLSYGWWGGEISRGVYGRHTPLALKAEVVIDGSRIANTDKTWQCSYGGPLLLGEIYDGEIYDARRTPTEWEAVKILEDMPMAVIPFEGPEVRMRDRKMWRHPQSITIYSDTVSTGTEYGCIKVSRSLKDHPFTLKKGETAVIDMGQNMVGWVYFEAKAERGTEILFHHGEMLNDNGDRKGRLDDGPGGSVWTYNLREADATLRYTFRGDQRGESYRPRHTFMGFRYVSVTATEEVRINRIVGQVVGSEIEEWGEFVCSDASINQLYSNIWWGQRGNFLSVPTDCPQRDERLGWTGDTQIFARTALYNSDAKDFYRKWMRDLRNSQREDGAYPDIAPYNNFWGYGTAAWGDAGIIVPWTVYVMTGDRTILEENYESNTRYMQWLATQEETVQGVRYTHIGAGTATGDWLAYAPLESRYVSVTYYAYVAQLMDSICTTLGKLDEAKEYKALYEDIRKEFQQRYMLPNGELKEQTQTAYLLALRFGLLPDEHREVARLALRSKIEENDYCLSTGFVGTGILCSTLTDEGMNELAYALLLQRKNPSWLYSIDQGATTVWERWDSYKREEGFNKHDWNMNSFNHYAYGAVAEWMYAYIAGIRPGKPGFKHIVFAPQVDNRHDNHPTLVYQPRITWAKAKTQTPHGVVKASWRQMKDGHYEYLLTLPAGVTYELQIPNLTEKDKVKVKQAKL